MVHRRARELLDDVGPDHVEEAPRAVHGVAGERVETDRHVELRRGREQGIIVVVPPPGILDGVARPQEDRLEAEVPHAPAGLLAGPLHVVHRYDVDRAVQPAAAALHVVLRQPVVQRTVDGVVQRRVVDGLQVHGGVEHRLVHALFVHDPKPRRRLLGRRVHLRVVQVHHVAEVDTVVPALDARQPRHRRGPRGLRIGPDRRVRPAPVVVHPVLEPVVLLDDPRRVLLVLGLDVVRQRERRLQIVPVRVDDPRLHLRIRRHRCSFSVSLRQIRRLAVRPGGTGRPRSPRSSFASRRWVRPRSAPRSPPSTRATRSRCAGSPTTT